MICAICGRDNTELVQVETNVGKKYICRMGCNVNLIISEDTCPACSHYVYEHKENGCHRVYLESHGKNDSLCVCGYSPERISELRNREGDQPLPVGSGASVTEAVIVRLRERERLGRVRYGDTLRTFNGRDALVDMLEERYDELQYLTQLLLERDANVETAVDLLTKAFAAKHQRDGDFLSFNEKTAYESGVRDAAKLYFLAAKVVHDGKA